MTATLPKTAHIDDRLIELPRAVHLLLTGPDGFVKLVDLNDPGLNGNGWLISTWSHVAHSGDDVDIERIYVLDPAINDGQPTLCKIHGTSTGFDEDDRATATHTVMLDQSSPHIVHRFSYGIDGRA